MDKTKAALLTKQSEQGMGPIQTIKSKWSQVKKTGWYRKLVPKIPMREELRMSAWEKFIKVCV